MFNSRVKMFLLPFSPGENFGDFPVLHFARRDLCVCSIECCKTISYFFTRKNVIP